MSETQPQHRRRTNPRFHLKPADIAILLVIGLAIVAAGWIAHARPSTAPVLPGLGADRQSWAVHHSQPTGRFSEVSYEADRVNAFVLNLGPAGVTEKAAKEALAVELPSDSRLVIESRKYLAGTDPDDQCDLIQYQSHSLGRVITDDPSGVITVRLSRLTDMGLGPYDPQHIITVSVLATGTLNDVPLEC